MGKEPRDRQTLRVNEIFGPTIQGEGPSAGQPATFLRLAGCNLDCGASPDARWVCDTPYAWDWKGVLGKVYDPADESHKTYVTDVADVCLERDPNLLVITGGEPMLQQKGIAALLRRLRARARHRQMRVEIETNGTIGPSAELLGARTAVDTSWNISPKLRTSGVAEDRAWNIEALMELGATTKARFKFVVTGQEDLDEVEAMCAALNVHPRSVWVMPAGTKTKQLNDVLDELADSIVALGYQVTTRLHIVMWGDKRGH